MSTLKNQPQTQTSIQAQDKVNPKAQATKAQQRSKSEAPKQYQVPQKAQKLNNIVTRVPESTNRTLVFPLSKGAEWEYSLKPFTTEKVAFRCTATELQHIFSDIYKLVENFKAVKATEKKKSLFSCFAASKPNSSRKEAASKIQQVLNMYAPTFNTRGLNLALNGQNIDWIELQLDYQPLTQIMTGMTTEPGSRKTSNAVEKNPEKSAPKVSVEPYRLTPSKGVSSQPTADTNKTSDNSVVSARLYGISVNRDNISSPFNDNAPSGSDNTPVVDDGAPGSNDNSSKPFASARMPTATFVSEEYFYGDAKLMVQKRTVPTFQSNHTEDTRRETQAEDIYEEVADDENGPAMNFAQESTTLHESSVKRHFYITSTY